MLLLVVQQFETMQATCVDQESEHNQIEQCMEICAEILRTCLEISAAEAFEVIRFNGQILCRQTHMNCMKDCSRFFILH